MNVININQRPLNATVSIAVGWYVVEQNVFLDIIIIIIIIINRS